jgi:hypothetical protein
VLALALHLRRRRTRRPYLRALELIGAVAGGPVFRIPGSWLGLARILRKLGRFDEAETRLLLAIAILERDGANTANFGRACR